MNWRDNPKVIGAFVISVAAILWGLDGVVLTPRLYNLDVAFVVFMLHFVPFVLMQPFLFSRYRYLARFTRNDWFYFGLVALFGGAIGTLAIVKALFLVNFDSLSVIVLLQKLQPVFAIILASIILKEKIKKHFLLWAGLAIVAGYFLTFGFALPNFSGDADYVSAAFYALLAAFSFGSATVFGKKVLQKFDFKTATFYRFGLTSLIMLVYVAFTGALFTQFPVVTPENWLLFLVIAVTTGSGAIFIYYYGLTRVKASVSTICELFFPVSAVFFDYIFNGHVLSLLQWIAAIVMVAAVLKITRDNAKA
ncbi:MAG: DMT family transporter [Candidatus Micrarchaeota archaeon]